MHRWKASGVSQSQTAHLCSLFLQLSALALGTPCAIFLVIGCGVTSGDPGAYVGRGGVYNYSPSVIQSGNLQQIWWCGGGNNPNQPSQVSDTILYASIDLTTKVMTEPYIVLGETPGSWDSKYVCNPKVIEGKFTNPLGDGQTYTYAMYYVGTAGSNANNIGVAFSNDGVHWKKYPKPVILATTQINYGVAQPAPYNSDHKSGIWLFYEDADNPPFNQHVETTSTDGIHFTVGGKLTTNGLPPDLSWGDMAYDSAAGFWYAVYNLPLRPPSMTGGITELGQPGVTMYRIKNSSLLTGSTPWQQLKTFDTNLTGNELNFIAGLLRDPYGDVNVGPYPAIEIFPSISVPPPSWNTSPEAAAKTASTEHWDIGKVEWVPGSPLMPLNRYFNRKIHEVTTGWVDPNGGFTLESTLGHLYDSPENGASLAFYGCKEDDSDYFMSLDSACEGEFVLGLEGYGYAQAQTGLFLVPLYSCQTPRDHFVSHDPNCEGHGAGKLLGFALQ